MIINELFQYRDLLYMLTVRDIRIRYKQAVMGFLWALFMPIVAVCAGFLIKAAMATHSGKEIEFAELASISVKVLPWTFFISALQFSVQSLVGNVSLVTKIYFPKAVLPLAATAACFVDFLLAVCVLVVLLTIVQFGISVYLLWIPFLMIILFLLTAGLGFMMASANLFFRDVKYIVQVILRFGIFFTPVFYEAKTFTKWGFLLLINPIGSILELINEVVVLKHAPHAGWLIYAIISSILIFYLGLVQFKKNEPLFSENI